MNRPYTISYLVKKPNTIIIPKKTNVSEIKIIILNIFFRNNKYKRIGTVIIKNNINKIPNNMSVISKCISLNVFSFLPHLSPKFLLINSNLRSRSLSVTDTL
jgi:hypothetical protein